MTQIHVYLTINQRRPSVLTPEKMSGRKVIIVKEGGGAQYTPAAENATHIQEKAYAFDNTWADFKATRRTTSLQRPYLVSEQAWDELMGLYHDSKKINWLVKVENNIHQRGKNLMFCTDDDVKASLLDILTLESPSKKYIKNICSMVRSAFRVIGREHSWGNGEEYKNLGRPLVFSGNPMTSAHEYAIIKDKCKNCKGRGKHGYAVSIVIVYMMLMCYLEKLLGLVSRFVSGAIKQVERIVNFTYLVMLYAFLMHEASRVSEITKYLKHENLYIPLHDQVYWLTLVFIKPQTLTYLLNNNILTHYVIELHKGKTLQHVRPRMKSIIPCPYNSIDLMFIYIVCMRIILTLNPSALSVFVFKQNLNYTSLRLIHAKMHAIFKQVKFYCLRYAAAEEDIRGNITPFWTRFRMGHTFTSNVKDQYAKNNNRVNIDDKNLAIGMDVFENATDPKIIPFEFNDLENSRPTYNRSWLETAFKDNKEMQFDFESTHVMVNKMLDGEDDDTKTILLDRLKETSILEWLKHLPFGDHLKLSAKLYPTEFFELFTNARQGVREYFTVVNEPSCIPELWSFPQIVYGNWRKLLNIKDATPPPIECIPKEAVTKSDGDYPMSDSDSDSDIESESDNGWSDGFEISNIEPNNIVVICCENSKDMCALRVPLLEDAFVWIVRVKSINILRKRTSDGLKMANIKGIFFKNKERDFTQTVLPSITTSIKVCETSVFHIFEEDNANVTLDDSQVEEITNFIKTRDN